MVPTERETTERENTIHSTGWVHGIIHHIYTLNTMHSTGWVHGIIHHTYTLNTMRTVQGGFMASPIYIR